MSMDKMTWTAPSEKVSSSMRKNAQIQILRRMRKVSSGHLLSIDTFYNVQ